MHRVSTLDFIHHSRGPRTCFELKIDLQPGDNHPDDGVDGHSRIANILDLAGLSQERNIDYKKTELWIDLVNWVGLEYRDLDHGR